MVKDIIQLGNNKLLEGSEKVNPLDISSGRIQELAKDLIDTCKFHVKVAAGLSAVQIDQSLRLFAVRRLDMEKDEAIDEKDIIWDVMINPTLTIKKATDEVEWEGCMSINSGDSRLFGPVYRPSEVSLSYIDLNGETKELIAKNFFSHLIQHEIDHLNGVLFLSHIKNPENIWLEKDLDIYLNQNNSFPPIK